MSLGNSLFQARKKAGLSQEAVAEKLGVSRQTISKWELDETLPDIRQSKKLSTLYRLTLDELIDFDVERKEIEEVIAHTSEETQKKLTGHICGGKNTPSSLPTSSRCKPNPIPRPWSRCWRGCGRNTDTAVRKLFWCSRTS